MEKSNGVNSQSLLIFIHTNSTAVDCEKEVVTWFLKCLTPLAESPPISPNHNQCDFHIISNVQHNDIIIEGDNNKYNKIVIALQNGQCLNAFDSIPDKADIIIEDEKPQHNVLVSDEILELLKDRPECVTKIGVSGVSIKCMKEYWGEMISHKPNIFDIAGKGFMKHPMWLYCNEWYDVRETSYNFGWENYRHNNS